MDSPTVSPSAWPSRAPWVSRPEARIKLLPPEAILARLEHSLRLLTGGGRDLPDRQQTLRATIAWSHDLLSEGARRLLATCSVFAGGASLEAIETVCDAAADIGLPVLDGLAELVDQNLMRQVRRPGPVRYALLETIREYAAERLGQLPAADRVRAAHAAAFLAWSRRTAACSPAWPGRTGSSGSRSSTTTSARPSAGTASVPRPPRCGWPPP